MHWAPHTVHSDVATVPYMENDSFMAAYRICLFLLLMLHLPMLRHCTFACDPSRWPQHRMPFFKFEIETTPPMKEAEEITPRGMASLACFAFVKNLPGCEHFLAEGYINITQREIRLINKLSVCGVCRACSNMHTKQFFVIQQLSSSQITASLIMCTARHCLNCRAIGDGENIGREMLLTVREQAWITNGHGDRKALYWRSTKRIIKRQSILILPLKCLWVALCILD